MVSVVWIDGVVNDLYMSLDVDLNLFGPLVDNSELSVSRVLTFVNPLHM